MAKPKNDAARSSTKNNSQEKGNPEEIWKHLQSLEKDEELADNIELAVKKMRRNLKLHRITLG